MHTLFIDESSPLDLCFDSGGQCIVFDTTHGAHIRRTVSVQNQTHLIWYSLLTSDVAYDVTFETHSGHTEVKALLTTSPKKTLTTTLTSRLIGNHAKTDVHVLSLVGEEGSVVLNGTIDITAGIHAVSGHILEENIFLGSRGTLRGIPCLLVHSDDVEAGHAARIERISDEKLYYLRARGIPHDDATVMMIQSVVLTLFTGLDASSMGRVHEALMRVMKGTA